MYKYIELRKLLASRRIIVLDEQYHIISDNEIIYDYLNKRWAYINSKYIYYLFFLPLVNNYYLLFDPQYII